MLDPEGPLYIQQQTLVKRLNDIKIKEKLIKYQIMNIQKTNGVYKFYMIENIETKSIIQIEIPKLMSTSIFIRSRKMTASRKQRSIVLKNGMNKLFG